MKDIKTKDFNGGFKTEHFYEVPFKIDPNAPPGQIYFLNEKNIEFSRIDARSRKQRIIDYLKKCYYKAMKKYVALATASVIVVVLTCSAIILSKDHQARVSAAKTSEVQNLKAQLKDTQNTLNLHDATNTKALSNAGQQIITLQQTNNTLCTQVKTAKLVQPLCR